MLDISTAKGTRAGTRTPEQRQKYLARQETKATTPAAASAEPAGGVSLPEQPAAFTPEPYEYAGQGWNDPIAQQVTKEYYANQPGAYERLQGMTGSAPGTVYNSPLSPESWGSVYRGQDFTDLGEKYKAAGGTYYNQFDPKITEANARGLPYNTATGESLPVMNMQTGIPQNALTGQPVSTGPASGSYHGVSPDILSRMWR
jgi:hypothetical protein